MSILTFDSDKFYLGALCLRDHQWKDSRQSLRHKANRGCIMCQRGRENGTYRPEPKITIRLDDKYYLGRLCKNNHDWDNTGLSRRSIKRRGCMQCSLEDMAQRRKNDEYHQKELAYKKQYYTTNLHRIKIYNETNREHLCHLKREWNRTNKERQSKRNAEYNRTEKGKQVRKEVDRRRKIKKRGNHFVNYSQEQLVAHYELFNNCCAYCSKLGELEIEHFIPVSMGGSDCLGNIVPACRSCNARKCNTDPFKWYSRQSFYDKKRWRFILQLLNKTENNYHQLPLF